LPGKRLAYGCGKVADILYQKVVFGDGPGDADNVGLLKCVVSYQAAWNLTGEDNHGGGVHVGIGDAGNRVCCTWA